MEAVIGIGELLGREGAARAGTVRQQAGARPARLGAAAIYAGLADAALHRDLAALRAYGALIAEEGLELDVASLPPACASFE